MKIRIYKLQCNDDYIDNLYAGSTKRTLNKRLGWHIDKSKLSPNRKVYKFIAENGGWTNWEIVELEVLVCGNETERLQRERYWQNLLQCSLNVQKVGNMIGKTKKEYNKEYYEQNVEHIKEYYEKNAEKIKENKKEYYEINKEKIKEHKNEQIICDNCGNFTARNNMKRHKRSKACQHKTTMTTYHQDYYQKNREGILAYKQERINCHFCDKTVARGYIVDHQKSHCKANQTPCAPK